MKNNINFGRNLFPPLSYHIDPFSGSNKLSRTLCQSWTIGWKRQHTAPRRIPTCGFNKAVTLLSATFYSALGLDGWASIIGPWPAQMLPDALLIRRRALRRKRLGTDGRLRPGPGLTVCCVRGLVLLPPPGFSPSTPYP
jgi:hypothetical protein